MCKGNRRKKVCFSGAKTYRMHIALGTAITAKFWIYVHVTAELGRFAPSALPHYKEGKKWSHKQKGQKGSIWEPKKLLHNKRPNAPVVADEFA